MKRKLLPVLLPVAAFALSWAGAHALTRRPPAPPATPPLAATKTPRPRGGSPGGASTSAAVLTHALSSKPLGEWSALWDDFARTASAAELEALPDGTFKPYEGAPDAAAVMRTLANEELALRAGKSAGTPGSLAVLAERNPEEAWQALRQDCVNSLACAVVRMEARRDPRGTLERFLALPEPRRDPPDEGRRGALYHRPVGSIFAAWARQDPQAAEAAAKTLRADLRQEAATEAAMVLAYRDGVAGLQAMLRFDHPKIYLETLPRSVVLRAALKSAPQEAARLLAQHESLRDEMLEENGLLKAFRWWYEADPQGVLQWLASLPADAKTADRYNFVIEWEAARDPEAAAQILRQAAPVLGEHIGYAVVRIARMDPELGTALADEYGAVEQVRGFLDTAAVLDDPRAACDRWLEAIGRVGPERAVKVLGSRSGIARELAGLASFALPEKAAALAKVVPVSQVAGRVPVPREIENFWPELAKDEAHPLEVPPPRGPAVRWLAVDPAAAAAELRRNPLGVYDAWNVMHLWAPHDPAAAGRWLEGEPPGLSRQLGELALAGARGEDGAAPQHMLRRFAALPPTIKLPNAERTRMSDCLHRLAETGGDWRKELAALPPELRESIQTRGIYGDVASSAEHAGKIADFLNR